MVTGWTLFAFGVAGATFAEVLNMRSLFNENRRKWNADSRKLSFWGFFLAFCVAGGTTAYAHGLDSQLSGVLALNVGFTWPLFLRRGAAALPDTDLGPVN
jgi:hypothetical protein